MSGWTLKNQEVQRISKEQMRTTIKRMSSGKTLGSGLEVWKCLGERPVDFLTRLFYTVLKVRRTHMCE